MSRLRMLLIAVLSLPMVVLFAGVGLGMVEESVDGDESVEEIAEPVLIYSYDVEAQVLTVAITDPENTEPECVPGEEGCPLVELDVTGPEGQVNHGQVVSVFAQWAVQYRSEFPPGCLIRVIASSDLGKGDQQVNVGEVDDDADAEEGDVGEGLSDEELTSLFDSALLSCQGGPDGEDEADEDEADEDESDEDSDEDSNGKPAWAGKPENPGRAFGLEVAANRGKK